MPLGHWQEARNQDGIIVRTRSNPRFGLMEFRAETAIAVEPDAILNRIRDPESFRDWYADLRESRLVERNADGIRWRQYLAMKQPFPVSDRDVLIELRSRQRSNVISVAIQAVPGDPVRGLVRMPYLMGFWRLASANGEGPPVTQVVHQVQAEAGGDVPAFVANAAVTNGPFQTLRGLRRLMEG